MSLLSHIDKISPYLLKKFINHHIKQTIRYKPRTRNSTTTTMTGEVSFLPKRALILRKFSRLEYERLCHPNLSEEQLAQSIESVLAANDIEYLTVDRFGYTEDKINWADVIITNGGDGTFLMAASKVTTRDKPVIGVNSDPTKSVGHLCLPSKYSNNFDKVIELLKQGKYQWQYKQRLRVTLIGEAADEDPRDLNDIRYNLRGINQFLDHDDCQDQISPSINRRTIQNAQHQQLPGPLKCPAVLLPNSTTMTNSSSSSGSNSSFSPKSPKEALPDTTTTTSSTMVTPDSNHNSTNFIYHSMEVSSSKVSVSDNKGGNSGSGIDVAQSNFGRVGKAFTTVDGKVVHKIRQLREKALNEVFVGESLTARVSYYELSVDNNKLIKMKSSGLTVCTGTGSTSWYYNINKLTEQQVQSIVRIINKVTKSTKVQPNDEEIIGDITKQFNETLTFSATEPIMAYSIRDPVDYSSGGGHSHRGCAKRIEVKSRMQNACIVLDGCQFYPFNDGSYVLIEMYDEDALKTLSIDSS